MANYLSAAVTSTGDVIGVYRDYDGMLRLQWVNSPDPEELPIEFPHEDLDVIVDVLTAAEAELNRPPSDEGGA